MTNSVPSPSSRPLPPVPFWISPVQEWTRQTKPKKGQFMNFSQGHSGTKVQCVNRACFTKEEHQNSQKWVKFMNFRFWPFLWFGLPGRLPNYGRSGKIMPLKMPESVFWEWLKVHESAWCPESPRTKRHTFAFNEIRPQEISMSWSHSPS